MAGLLNTGIFKMGEKEDHNGVAQDKTGTHPPHPPAPQVPQLHVFFPSAGAPARVLSLRFISVSCAALIEILS